MQTEPQKEHEWLQKLTGEWMYDVEAAMERGKPPEHFRGTETVRSIGGLWIVAEGEGEMPGGGTAMTLLTLGYDPRREKFLGTWIGSMMTHLWLYEGELDAAGKVLTLDTEGPGMTEGKMEKFRDVIELQSDDRRVLTSHMMGEDGTWYGFMRANYRRK